MTNLGRDLGFGFRLLFKNPGFASIAVLALTLGIAANTAIFSVVYATLLAPLPYPHPEHLVMVWSKIQDHRDVTAAGDFLEWQRTNATFQTMCAWSGRGVNLATANRPELVLARIATPGMISMMGDRFLLGRDFLPEEGQPGKDHEAILTNKLWRGRFGADPNIVGRQVQMNGAPYTIVGVLAPGLADRQWQIHLPLAFKPEQINHDYRRLQVTGRLKPGVTLAQANADMEGIARRLAEIYPDSDKGWSAGVSPYEHDSLGSNLIRGLCLMMGAVGFVLLIACANVANLLLARATTRQKEVAVRASLGASRGRLFGQFLAESLALAAIGCVTGTGIAWILLKVIDAMMPAFLLPPEADLRLSIPVLLFTVAASLLAGVLFGCAPAWQAARMNLNDVLKGGGRTGFGGGRHGLRRALVVAEFALALSLLAGGGLAIRGFWNLTHVELGFRSDHLFTFFLPVSGGRLTDAKQVTAFYRRLLEKIQALPGVTSVSASEGMPIVGANFNMPFQIAGKLVDDPSQRPSAGFNMVTPDYFKTFGIRMNRGRAITEQDIAGNVPVAVVNESFVKEFLPDVDPLTQRIRVEQLTPGAAKPNSEIEWQIVGVSQDVRNGGPRESFDEIDVPFWQSPYPQAFVAVRAAGHPAALRESIADAVQSLDPNLPLKDAQTMDQVLEEYVSGDRFNALLFGSFAGVALLLAALGIYGVMSFAVAQRTHEIGLRMALGAGPGRVLALVLREGMILAGVGIGFGLIGAYFVGRALHLLFYDVGSVDAVVFAAVSVPLLLSALLACFVPAHRAARVDPMQALRQE